MGHEQLAQTEFAENPEPRCAVVLLLDTSLSMRGQPIVELNDGLKEFERAIKADQLASLRVEVAVITFGGTVRALDLSGSGDKVIPFDANQAFVTASDFHSPVLEASGETPLGEAVRRALTLLRERKDIYKQADNDYFRPWIFLITDGEPTDQGWEATAELVKQEERGKGVVFYGVGVDKANMQKLSRFSDTRPPLKLKGLAFRELFEWVSNSLARVGHSEPGDQVALPPVNSWAELDTSH